MNRRMTEEQGKKTFERALKMEQEFGEYFTGKCETVLHKREGGRGVSSNQNELLICSYLHLRNIVKNFRK